MTWPSDPKGRQIKQKSSCYFAGKYFLVKNPINPMKVNESISQLKFFPYKHTYIDIWGSCINSKAQPTSCTNFISVAWLNKVQCKTTVLLQ